MDPAAAQTMTWMEPTTPSPAATNGRTGCTQTVARRASSNPWTTVTIAPGSLWARAAACPANRSAAKRTYKGRDQPPNQAALSGLPSRFHSSTARASPAVTAVTGRKASAAQAGCASQPQVSMTASAAPCARATANSRQARQRKRTVAWRKINAASPRAVASGVELDQERPTPTSAPA